MYRNGEEKAAGSRTKWFFDGKILEAVFTDKRSRRQITYEVHVADLVIDEESGEILEIHILPDKHEAPELIKHLKQKKILK